MRRDRLSEGSVSPNCPIQFLIKRPAPQALLRIESPPPAEVPGDQSAMGLTYNTGAYGRSLQSQCKVRYLIPTYRPIRCACQEEC